MLFALLMLSLSQLFLSFLYANMLRNSTTDFCSTSSQLILNVSETASTLCHQDQR